MALMYSALQEGRWVWKTIPFEITDRLHERGLVDEPRSHRKSVCLTDKGLEQAKAAFDSLCGEQCRQDAQEAAMHRSPG